MQSYKDTAQLIATKLKSQADVLTFRPVFHCEDALFSAICHTIAGRVLCVLPTTPNSYYRKKLSDRNCFFIGYSLRDDEIKTALKESANQESCILFASLSVLHQDYFIEFINNIDFSAMLILHAERCSPLTGDFDKRMARIRELRAQLCKPLALCAFCASDASAILRDISATLELKTPARVYPGVENSNIKLQTDNSIPPFAALENRIRQEGICKAVVLCSERQIAEDAYRYFRFFGYKCAVSHAELHYEPRQRAIERFIRGDADILFTTSFQQAPFCLQEYFTAFIGLPRDIFNLQYIACPNQNVTIYYSKDDCTVQLYRIEEDNEIRSTYSSLPPALFKQERLYANQQMLFAIQNEKSPYDTLQEMHPQIYYEEEGR